MKVNNTKYNIIEVEGKKYHANKVNNVGSNENCLLLTPVSVLINHDFQAGDVFKDPSGNTNNLLLVKVRYYGDSYQLLGLGCFPNSNPFYYEIHPLSEICDHLAKNNMVFYRNINSAVLSLVSDTVV